MMKSVRLQLLVTLVAVATVAVSGCGGSEADLAHTAHGLPPVMPDFYSPSPLRMEFKGRLAECNGEWSETVTLMKEFAARGPAAVAMLLDVYCPESRPLPDDRSLRNMVEQLRAEDPDVQCRAAVAIGDLGPLVRPRLEQILAGVSPSCQTWLDALSARWEAEQIPDPGQSEPALSIVLIGVKDQATLDIMADRVSCILEEGRPKSEHEQLILRMLHALGRSGDDQYSDLLRPFLAHPDERVALMVVQGIGGGRNNRYIPPLLLEALDSPRVELAKQAIGYSCNLWGRKRVEAVRAALYRHFHGDNEELKFHAAFALMHDLADPEATAYILSQTQNPDRQRALRAISWIGDSCNSGKPASLGLLDALAPHLESADVELRRAAADALGTYSGPQVIWLLIPALNDPDGVVSSRVFSKLRHHPHQQLIISSLWAYRHGRPESPLRNRIDELLNALNAPEASR